MRMVISYKVATGEAVGTTLTQSVPGRGGITLAVPTQTAVNAISAVLSLSAGRVTWRAVLAGRREHLAPAMSHSIDDVNDTWYAAYG